MVTLIRNKIELATKTLLNGGIIICPTEGVFGISTRVSNTKAIERVIDIKKRSADKGFIIVASSIDMLESMVDFQSISQESLNLMNSKWPGHNTFIVPVKEKVSPLLTGGRNTLAVRVTAFPLLANICNIVGEPIVSTSANFSGDEPISDLYDLKHTFSNKVDFILDEPCQGMSKPSSIYDAVTGALLRP